MVLFVNFLVVLPTLVKVIARKKKHTEVRAEKARDRQTERERWS